MQERDDAGPEQTPAEARHEAARGRWEAEARSLGAKADRLSFGRLGAFLAAVVLGASASGGGPAIGAAAALAALAFVALVLVHARVLARKEDAEAREAVHARHLQRVRGAWLELPPTGAGAMPADHAYAVDIDLVGAGSLAQRIDVTHTTGGEACLLRWLGAPAEEAEIAARQAAVAELAEALELREDLEAFAARGRRALARSRGRERAPKLDPEPFLTFTRREALVHGSPLALLVQVLPIATLAAAALAGAGLVPGLVIAGLATVQVLVAWRFGFRAVEAFQLVAARRGYVEAFRTMLEAVETRRFESARLEALRERVHVAGAPPSAYLARLDRWAGLAELHTQFLVHIFVNLGLLWDLNVLLRLERWTAEVGEGLDGAFEALAELEALASLATLLDQDPAARFPEIADAPTPLAAKALAHPLLPPAGRVANDVGLPGLPGALIVTGSNMAGKSTLLRAVGLNLALAFAGGPVVAGAFRTSRVRLRASMRVDDSLQRGASYFRAELTKLRSVVAEAGDTPPLFFLLDELLRGTNARARHIGARAVLTHLLDHGALGLAATHDVALARLADERPGVANVHFTDVLHEGEMVFDYRLREGVVKTSNALRLLALAGIAVPEDDALPTEAPA
ncbi:MAG: DNA mismatch repair protein MutS [Myxococcota bacterium]